jgi:hypothetical protein
MKKHLLIGSLCISVLAFSPALSHGAQTAQKPQPNTTKQTPNPMSKAEMDFANKLSALHKQIFMTVFTPALRQEAMSMMSNIDEDDMDDESIMTEDMAVEQTIMNHRDAALPDDNAPAPQVPTTPSSYKKSK